MWILGLSIELERGEDDEHPAVIYHIMKALISSLVNQGYVSANWIEKLGFDSEVIFGSGLDPSAISDLMLSLRMSLLLSPELL